MSAATPSPTTASLGPASVLAEQGFLAAGRSLEGALEILDGLTRRFAGYVAELTGGMLDETSASLASASAQVAALAGGHRSDMTALDPLAEIVARIHRRVTALQPTTREVETMALNARVVAAGMGTAGEDFLAFSGSIRGAAQEARSSLLGVRDGLAAVDRDLNAARAEAAAFARRHGATMQSIPMRLTANLHGLTEQQALAAEAAAAAHRQAEDVRSQVASQIVALQLGDITRQRVEHVQAAGELVAGAGYDLRRVGRVIEAQLRDVADTLNEEGERIEARLTRLATAADTIRQLGTRLRGATSGRDGGFVAALEADVRQTAAPLAELRAADAATDRRVAAVLRAAEQLATRFAALQSVEEDIRIMGLNATLKCGRLGQVGRPLAVVAQELRGCGGRFATEVTAALGDLGRLRSIAADLRDPARETRHATFAAAMDGMLSTLLRLGQLEDGMASALAQIHADADAIGRLVDVALSEFSGRHALAATLREVAGAFASEATEDEPPTADEQDVLDRIALGYTMAREREVHARFAPLPGQLATEPITADDTSDFLF